MLSQFLEGKAPPLSLLFMFLSYVLQRKKQKRTCEFLTSQDSTVIANFLIHQKKKKQKNPNQNFFQQSKQVLVLAFLRLIMSC